MQTEKYLQSDVLFHHGEQNSVPCIPESCVEYIIDLYCNSLLEVHKTKNILNNQKKLYIYYLMHYISSFLK